MSTSLLLRISLAVYRLGSILTSNPRNLHVTDWSLREAMAFLLIESLGSVSLKSQTMLHCTCFVWLSSQSTSAIGLSYSEGVQMWILCSLNVRWWKTYMSCSWDFSSSSVAFLSGMCSTVARLVKLGQGHCAWLNWLYASKPTLKKLHWEVSEVCRPTCSRAIQAQWVSNHTPYNPSQLMWCLISPPYWIWS